MIPVKAIPRAGALTAALVLDGVRAMSPAERDELRVLLELDRRTSDDKARWLDTRAAAAYLGVHRDTLRKLAAAGAIPNTQAGLSCRRYFNKAELDRWRESGGRFHAASTVRKPHELVGRPR